MQIQKRRGTAWKISSQHLQRKNELQEKSEFVGRDHTFGSTYLQLKTARRENESTCPSCFVSQIVRRNKSAETKASALIVATRRNESYDYGFFGIVPGWNKSERSTAFAASRRYGPTWNTFCHVCKSDECV